jgi:hypothetical protein
MKTEFNPWESISGAVCLNIFMNLVKDEPKKIDDLVLPLSCALYISEKWNDLNFSKTDNISELRNYVAPDVSQMKDILLQNQSKIVGQVTSYLDHLNGSLALSVLVIQALYNGNHEIYKNNLKSLFQESWEIIFWYLQDLKDESTRKLFCDYANHHVSTFKDVIKSINDTNPL